MTKTTNRVAPDRRWERRYQQIMERKQWDVGYASHLNKATNAAANAADALGKMKMKPARNWDSVHPDRIDFREARELVKKVNLALFPTMDESYSMEWEDFDDAERATLLNTVLGHGHEEWLEHGCLRPTIHEAAVTVIAWALKHHAIRKHIEEQSREAHLRWIAPAYQQQVSNTQITPSTIYTASHT